ncbi:hypothetical protein SAMN04488505_101633 [Chitinophaga rupis]|uniref:Uncharacterized protein n=1 Tax=Chitinophaga rupis TaxID=573321 RepID=A0A1H7IS66_9BACT|nr:hypothetical protein SAMN04488505_101633 [Chitinophaga rupis]
MVASSYNKMLKIAFNVSTVGLYVELKKLCEK